MTIGRSSSDALDGRAHRCGDSNCIGVVASAAFDSVTRRQKCVKALNQIWVAGEELRNAINDTWCVNTELVLLAVSPVTDQNLHSRLGFEILHNVKKPVVNIGLVVKLNFDLVQVRQGIL